MQFSLFYYRKAAEQQQIGVITIMEYQISDKMSKVRGSIIREIFKVAADPTVISLAGGNPAPETFPGKELADIAQRLLTEQPTLSLQYGISEGYEPLRQKVRQMLKDSEGISGEGNQVLITAGGTQVMDLLSKVLLNEGDIVIVEEPSFIGAMNTFRGYNAKLVGVPMDENGMDTDALEKTLEKAVSNGEKVKFIYTIPTFQNPSGITMSLERRKKMYDIAKKYQVVILEDNPYGELTFTGNKVPTIKSFDDEGIVVYAGSFSKILSPGMRLGFALIPDGLMPKMTIAKQMADVHSNVLSQIMASEFMEQYDIYEFIARSRELYRTKCQCMLDCLEKYMPDGITWTKPEGGLFIWVTMPEGYDSMKVNEICGKSKVAFVPGNAFMVDMDAPCNCFRLNYSTMSEERIEEGVRILGEVLTDVLK